MARIYSIGFETNTLTNGVECNSATISNGGGFSIQTGTIRTGTYALKVNPAAPSTGDTFQIQNSSSHIQYNRFYIYVTARPTGSDTSLFLLADASNGVAVSYLALNTDGSLALVYSNTSGGFSQLGSNSSIIPLNTWTRIEHKGDDTAGVASTTLEARLNGVVFATGTVAINSGETGLPNGFSVIGDQIVGANQTGTWYIDDWANNDGSGTSQNSYPGIGAITRITPNATGDANAWPTAVGGTAGATNNFTRVDETTPDDVTSYNGSTVLNQQDLFKCTDPAIGTDTVNCVQVMARYRNNIVDVTTAFVIQCEKVSAGTLSSGAAIDPDSTTWTTCTPAGSLVLYKDPDGTAWTESTLATMQIGYKISTAHTNAIDITNIWAYVDHVPTTNTANFFPFFRP